MPQQSHLPPVAPSQPGYYMLVPGHQQAGAVALHTGQAAPAAVPLQGAAMPPPLPPLPRPSSGKQSGAAAAGGKGKGARRAQPGGMSRAQTRLLQRRQREIDQGVIKGLEHQLGSLREQLQVSRRG